ncbi:MAG: aminoacyl-tRNA hydrolase [Eubacterium sp.]|nr:aminoacyl-tRNA hydrolase [Eubacterium sp.]MEE3398797.1 aminoacyl-tRNA hydrolase [Eubacterium sp.]
MKIIVGLGNPGLKYAGTRHNAGFSVLTGISDKYNIPINKKECKALTGHGVIAGEKVVLAMPQTYMNLSGDAVGELVHFYKCTAEDVIVIYDDTDLDVGRLRIRKQGSAGGHNGIKSIIASLGTDVFDRVKVGIGHKPADWDLADYVLGRFMKEELPVMREAVEKATDAVTCIVESGADMAMNHFN